MLVIMKFLTSCLTIPKTQQFPLQCRISLTQFMVVCLSGVCFTFVMCSLSDLRAQYVFIHSFILITNTYEALVTYSSFI